MKLELYYRTFCPFSRKVVEFIEENGIEVALHNLQEDPAHKDALITRGGKEQVPCLLIDDKPLYESGDIIEWLSKNKV